MTRAIIVGSGVVGSATGVGLEAKGHRVEYVDINAQRVAQLQNEGRAASTSIDLSGDPAFVFVTVPTPNNGNKFALSAIRAASKAVGVALRDANALHTVVVRSTVPPGTCEQVVVPELEQASGARAGAEFAVASNPEFLRAACSCEDFLMPRVTVVGSRSARTVERMVELYADFGGEIRTFTNPAEAEFVKCAHNLYNATKISFWNEMWRVATKSRIRLDEVASTVALSAEASFNPSYGTRGGSPYGGACLPKDTRGFLGYARDLDVDMPLLEGVIAVNEHLEADDAEAALDEPDAAPREHARSASASAGGGRSDHDSSFR